MKRVIIGMLVGVLTAAVTWHGALALFPFTDVVEEHMLFPYQPREESGGREEQIFSHAGGSLEPVPIPREISFVGSMLYDRVSQQLLFLAKDRQGNRGVWAYDGYGVFERLLDDRLPFRGGFLHQDAKGNIYYSANDPGVLYRSETSGRTWGKVLEGNDPFWTIADTGEGMLLGTSWSQNSPRLYRSIDQGKHWEEWIDFHRVFPKEKEPYIRGKAISRMRHLHDVAVANGGIFVGTGDVTRWGIVSRDNGMTWKKFWDEGFTSHIFDQELGLLLFGADRGHLRGIARYDINTQTVEDVWQGKEGGWPAYIYSMMKKDGGYYAAVHVENNENGSSVPYGILSSSDSRTWGADIELTTRDPFTTLLLADSPDEYLFVNLNGALYRYWPKK